MNVYEDYNKLKENINNFDIPYEYADSTDNIIWIPKLCSKSPKNNAPLICIVYHGDYIRCFIGKSRCGHIKSNKRYTISKDSNNFHEVITEIFRFYYKEIEKTLDF